MSDLVAFLAARLDEDEAVAKAAEDASSAAWWLNPNDEYDEWPASVCEEGTQYRVLLCDPPEGTHAALHDPARVLREVAAGRKVLAWYADSLDASETFREKLGTGTHMATAAESYLNVIQLLAAVYAGHPGYDPAWAPPA